MDWNGNGRIDVSDILITELFEEELNRDRGREVQRNATGNNEDDPGENIEDSER